jgi:hypothetical protein
MKKIRKFQYGFVSFKDKALAAIKETGNAASEQLKAVDEFTNMTSKAKGVAEFLHTRVVALDESLKISGVVKQSANTTQQAYANVLDNGKKLVESSGLTKEVGYLHDKLQDSLIDPTKAFIKSTGVEKYVDKSKKNIENIYGKVRGVIKPYFPAVNSHELLQKTRSELVCMSACIMQISQSESEQLSSQLGKAVLSKISGIGTAGALMGLVSTFGTAGTGTAIGTLSGAAATNASLAWVGGLVGGGMATGVLLTGGLSVVVGLAAYKALGTNKRPFESLSDVEQKIVQAAWVTATFIDDFLTKPAEEFSKQCAEELLMTVLQPMYKDLITNSDAITKKLDGTHSVAFRQHVLNDFKRVVIDGFEEFINGYCFKGFIQAEYVISGVFYALWTQTALDGSLESQLVLDALRRSNLKLIDATENELGEYLRDFPTESLRGLSANIKGIYHELLYVQNYNSSNEETRAQVFGTTNNAGADIQIVDIQTGTVIEEFQLKAVSGTASVYGHLKNNPDIEVIVTSEVAMKLNDDKVSDSGLSNEELTSRIGTDFQSMIGNSELDRTLESAFMAAGISSIRDLAAMIEGTRTFPDVVTNALKAATPAAGATALTAYLFG